MADVEAIVGLGSQQLEGPAGLSDACWSEFRQRLVASPRLDRATAVGLVLATPELVKFVSLGL